MTAARSAAALTEASVVIPAVKLHLRDLNNALGGGGRAGHIKLAVALGYFCLPKFLVALRDVNLPILTLSRDAEQLPSERGPRGVDLDELPRG